MAISQMPKTEFNTQIENLDFSRFQEKLHNENPERGWDGGLFHIGIKEYKRFLELKLEYPRLIFSPTKLMDEIWHLHILDTRNYHEDCIRIFDKYLHHAPSFGSWDTEFQTEELHNSKKNLAKYYRKKYGEKPRGLDGDCQGGCGDCQGNCGCST